MNIFSFIASFLSGVLSSLGFGAGSILILYLTAFLDISQKKAQGINLVFFIPSAIYSIIYYKKNKLIEKENTLSLIFFGVVGVIVGYLVLDSIPSEILSKFFGGFLIILALRDFISIVKSFKKGKSKGQHQ